MKYYFLHQQYLSDGTTVFNPIAEYDNIDSAKSAWHSVMSYNMIAENVIGALVIIYEPNGNEVLKDYWQKSYTTTEETVTE